MEYKHCVGCHKPIKYRKVYKYREITWKEMKDDWVVNDSKCICDREERYCAYCGALTRWRNKRMHKKDEWEIVNSPCKCTPPANPYVQEDYSI